MLPRSGCSKLEHRRLRIETGEVTPLQFSIHSPLCRRRKLGKPRSKLPQLRLRKILIITRLFGGEQKQMKLLTLGLLSRPH